jgi:hypothetical protein
MSDTETEDGHGTYRRVGGWSLMQWPPFAIEKVTYINYVLDADMGALQRLVDEFFNQPSGGAVLYRPLVPQVFFSYADIQEATSSDPRAGSTPEKDIMLWTPVVQLTPDGSRVLAVPVFCPFVFVTNPTAVSLGREMFGFPKNWCELVSAPDGPGSKTPILVKAYTKPADQKVLAPRRILELTCTGGSGEPVWIHETVEVLEEIVRLLGSFVTDANGLGIVLNAEALASAAASLLQKKQSFVFLKQFPSMSAPNQCCYQAIGEMATTLGTIDRFAVLPYDYTLDYVDDMFHHFSESFGWGKGPLPVRAAFYIDFSFTLVSGRVLWEAK